MQEAGGNSYSCVPGGSFTTPTFVGPYSTLQSHRRETNYSPSARVNYASLRRGVYPSCGLDMTDKPRDIRHTKLPSISPTYPVGVSTGSSVSSAELNHSVTTSDTSDVSSERDRESEV